MKNTCEVNQKLYIELNQTVKKNSKISLIFGIIGLVAYIGISVYKEYAWLDYLLWISAILFGFGLVFVLTINKSIKKAKDNIIVTENEIEETFMNITDTKNGEQVGSAKIYYKDIIKVKETQNYLFLYPNKQMAYPISKQGMKAEEIAQVKNWINSARTSK